MGDFILQQDEVCRLLDKYPFSLVQFRPDPNNPGLYRAYRVGPEYLTQSYAQKGLIPRLDYPAHWPPPPLPPWYPPWEQLQPTWRRDSFFGIINSQEEIVWHDIDYDVWDEVKICQEPDGTLFMQKGNVFRMPLVGILTGLPSCQCHCGPLRESSVTLHIGNGGAIPEWMLVGFTPGSSTSIINAWEQYWPNIPKTIFGLYVVAGQHASYTWAGQTWSYSYIQPLGGIWYRQHSWLYGTYIVLGIFSPQHSFCDFSAPPLHPHPKCPDYEIAEYKLVYWTGSFAGYDSWLMPSEQPQHIWSSTILNGPVINGQVLQACYSPTGPEPIPSILPQPIFTPPDLPVQPHITPDPADYPSYPAAPTAPPWDPWNLTGGISFSDPIDVGNIACEDCACRERTPQWTDPC